MRPHAHPTDSELEFLELAGRGKGSREIARTSRLSEKSVTATRSQLREELNKVFCPAWKAVYGASSNSYISMLSGATRNVFGASFTGISIN